MGAASLLYSDNIISYQASWFSGFYDVPWILNAGIVLQVFDAYAYTDS